MSKDLMPCGHKYEFKGTDYRLVDVNDPTGISSIEVFAQLEALRKAKLNASSICTASTGCPVFCVPFFDPTIPITFSSEIVVLAGNTYLKVTATISGKCDCASSGGETGPAGN